MAHSSCASDISQRSSYQAAVTGIILWTSEYHRVAPGMGVLVGLGSDPNAVCDLAAGFGFTCEECPDGGRYCVRIEAYFEPSPLVEGLTLVE